MAQLRSVTCHMGSHSVTCYPTQVNTPRLVILIQGAQCTVPAQSLIILNTIIVITLKI